MREKSTQAKWHRVRRKAARVRSSCSGPDQDGGIAQETYIAVAWRAENAAPIAALEVRDQEGVGGRVVVVVSSRRLAEVARAAVEEEVRRGGRLGGVVVSSRRLAEVARRRRRSVKPWPVEGGGQEADRRGGVVSSRRLVLAETGGPFCSSVG